MSDSSFFISNMIGIKFYEYYANYIHTRKSSQAQEESKRLINMFEALMDDIAKHDKHLALQMKSTCENVIKKKKPIADEISKIENTPKNDGGRIDLEKNDLNFEKLGIGIEIYAKGLMDSAGYDKIKRVLKMCLIWPIKHPGLFGNRKRTTSILLYGPPGTGKSHLVHALAAEANASLFSVLSSNIISSMVGQTEKAINIIFSKMKSADKPTILFIDEVDGLFLKRSEREFDHTRRFKNDLMCHLTDFDKNPNSYLIGATNRPWDIDSAFIRRFKKVLYVPLPDDSDRTEIIKLLTKNTPLSTFTEWEDIIRRTEGYSGSDLQALIETVLSKPITALCDTVIWKKEDNKYSPFKPEVDDLSHTNNIVFCPFDEMAVSDKVNYELRDPDLSDVLSSLSEVKPSVSAKEISKFEEYASN